MTTPEDREHLKTQSDAWGKAADDAANPQQREEAKQLSDALGKAAEGPTS